MGTLAARAANHSMIRRDVPLTDDQIRSVAPSIYAEAAHSSRSDRYKYIPTIEVVNALRKEGFQPFMAAQAKVSKKGLAAGKQDYTRHLLRLRHPDLITSKEAAQEIILLNSHDGTSSYQLLSGAFRFVCMNGLVCGDVDQDIRVYHKGETAQIENVIEGAFEVLSNSRRDYGMIEDMRSYNTTPVERFAFAQAAIELRFGEGNNVLTPTQMLESRRPEDNGNDLWSVFNRVQENAIDGGMDGRSKNNRVRRVRPLVGMDKDTNLNRALWRMVQTIKNGTEALAA